MNKITRLAALAVALLPLATACTPEEIRLWEQYVAEQPAAEPAPAASPVEASAPYDEAVRVDYPEACLSVEAIDQEIYAGRVDPGLVTWFLLNTTIVFGYSHYETTRIYRTVDCLMRSPD